MNEIEKMVLMREAVALDSDREAIVAAMEALANAFHQLIFATRGGMLGEAVTLPDVAELRGHMELLRTIGARFGIDFPSTETDAELRQFVMKFGMEVIKG